MLWIIGTIVIIFIGGIIAINKKDVIHWLFSCIIAIIFIIVFGITNIILDNAISTEIYNIEEYKLTAIDDKNSYLLYNIDSQSFSCLTQDKNNNLETKNFALKHIEINDTEKTNPRLIIEYKRPAAGSFLKTLFIFDETIEYKIYIPYHSTKYIRGE